MATIQVTDSFGGSWYAPPFLYGFEAWLPNQAPLAPERIALYLTVTLDQAVLDDGHQFDIELSERVQADSSIERPIETAKLADLARTNGENQVTYRFVVDPHWGNTLILRLAHDLPSSGPLTPSTAASGLSLRTVSVY